MDIHQGHCEVWYDNHGVNNDSADLQSPLITPPLFPGDIIMVTSGLSAHISPALDI